MIMIQGVPKKVGFTATITSSKSHFFFGTPCTSPKQKTQLGQYRNSNDWVIWFGLICIWFFVSIQETIKTKHWLWTDIQIGTNHMNKNRARVELYKLYTGPAFIHMVCPNLYITISYSATKCIKPLDS